MPLAVKVDILMLEVTHQMGCPRTDFCRKHDYIEHMHTVDSYTNFKGRSPIEAGIGPCKLFPETELES